MGGLSAWNYNEEPSIDELVTQFQTPGKAMIGALLKIAHSSEILARLPYQGPPYRIVDPKVVERGVNTTALWNNPWTVMQFAVGKMAGNSVNLVDLQLTTATPAQDQTEKESQWTGSGHKAATLIQARTERNDQIILVQPNSDITTKTRSGWDVQHYYPQHNNAPLRQAHAKREALSRKRKFVLCDSSATIVHCPPKEDQKLTLSQGYILAKRARAANQTALCSKEVPPESV